jgi:hypothetical protein
MIAGIFFEKTRDKKTDKVLMWQLLSAASHTKACFA